MIIKENSIYYINVAAIRSFIHLYDIYNYIQSLSDNRWLANESKKQLGSITLSFSHRFKNLEEADKYCSKCCDGMTEMTVKIEVIRIHELKETRYDIAISNPTWDEKYRERVVIRLASKKQIEGIINYKIKEAL